MNDNGYTSNVRLDVAGFTLALCFLLCLQQADKAIAEGKLAAAKPALAEAEAALQVRSETEH